VVRGLSVRAKKLRGKLILFLNSGFRIKLVTLNFDA
jgi:hypothetical protein